MYLLYKKRKEVASNFLDIFHYIGADYPPWIFAKYPPQEIWLRTLSRDDLGNALMLRT